MGRFIILKERKHRVKAISCSLVLASIISSLQGLETYSLFTDTENIESNLVISIGDLDIEVSEGNVFTDVEPGKEITMPVKIMNNGTLNQNIKLDLFIDDKIKQHIKSKLVFDGVTIDKENGVMYKGTELFVLSPGKSIEGSVNITVKKDIGKEIQNILAEKVQNINLTIKSTQISYNNKELFNNGFYDEVTQTNKISIKQSYVDNQSSNLDAEFADNYRGEDSIQYEDYHQHETEEKPELSESQIETEEKPELSESQIETEEKPELSESQDIIALKKEEIQIEE